jgi:hypothetical protein
MYRLGPKGGVRIGQGRGRNVNRRRVRTAVDLDPPTPFGVSRSQLSFPDAYGRPVQLALGSKCGWLENDDGSWTHLTTSVYHRIRDPRIIKRAKQAKATCKKRAQERKRKRKASQSENQSRTRKRRKFAKTNRRRTRK